MTIDQLTLEQKASDIVLGSLGWGFGVSVVTRRDSPISIGTFGWNGGLGTCWYTDPREEVITILMTQKAMESASPPGVFLDFWTSAYAAIDD